MLSGQGIPVAPVVAADAPIASEEVSVNLSEMLSNSWGGSSELSGFKLKLVEAWEEPCAEGDIEESRTGCPDGKPRQVGCQRLPPWSPQRFFRVRGRNRALF